MGREFPARIAQYELKQILGEGGFGVVYRAWDTELESDVAIKIPKLEGVDGKHAELLLARFLREARAAARLPPHTNLCPVRQVGEVDGQKFVVMAFINGQPLSETARPLEVKVALELVKTIAHAMQVAHNQGVVHRDLKPANIMLTPEFQPVVMDFGLALRVDVKELIHTPSGSILGTPQYMSLEQFSGRSEDVGPQTDIYSLGVILYELLTGRLPYEGTLPEIVGKIFQGDFLLPSHWNPQVPAQVDELCRKVMAKDKAERHQSMNEFASAIGRCIAGVQRTGTSPGGFTQPDDSKEWSSRSKQVTISGGSHDETLGSPKTNKAPFDQDTAWDSQEHWSRFLSRPVSYTNCIEMEFMLVPPGEFLMGSPATELERHEEEFQHLVQITQPFYCGVYPVTQREFTEVMDRNPSQFNEKELGYDAQRFPVEMVSWYDCLDFCNKLSALDGRPAYYKLSLTKFDDRGFIKWAKVKVVGGLGYRLLTEAEWEYACRAGTQTATSFGDALSSNDANFNGNSPYGDAQRGPYLAHPSSVEAYPANQFGLHDFHGNVSEWCWDAFDADYYRQSPTKNPAGPDTGTHRVHRGGCWRDRGSGTPGGSGYMRSAARHECSPVVRLCVLGFRIAANALPQSG